MRVHFHSYSHSHFSEPEPPPAWLSKVPPLRHVWVSSGSADGFADMMILGAIVLVLVLRFLWRLAGMLAGGSGR